MQRALTFRRVARLRPYICSECISKRVSLQGNGSWPENAIGRRSFAQDARSSPTRGVLDVLEKRNLIQMVTGGRDELRNILDAKSICAYVGVDPTAPSMHVGNLLPFLALFWLCLHGHNCVALVGGSTATVGDPTGRTTSRSAVENAAASTDNITSQLQGLWDRLVPLAEKHGYMQNALGSRAVLNNASWLSGVSLMDFLDTLGSGLRMGSLLSRDTVSTKLKSADGMSFAEFAYPLLQSWDWWHMYHTQDVQLQVGGSDQFGNIITGVESINYVARKHPDQKYRNWDEDPSRAPFGLTVPLLTTADGSKFGKSAGNAVWLDKSMTSVFNLYGFFVRTADNDVDQYLKRLTFLPLGQIEEAMLQHDVDPSKRVPQHLLAKELVTLIHGSEEAEQAEQQHRALFQRSNSIPVVDSNSQASKLSSQYASTGNGVVLPLSVARSAPIPKLLVLAGLVSSRNVGLKLVKAGGAYLGITENGERVWRQVKEPYKTSGESFIMDKSRIFIRSGKWNVRVIEVVSDEEFNERGLTIPE